jgi:tryptophan synthase alpha subunit
MKVKFEIDCTPEEARAFLGLPDVTPLNEHMIAEMKKRMDANISMLKPEEMMKAWTGFGLNAQEQFRQLMTAAAGGGLGGGGFKPGG